ncbi:hypothetical protein Tco_1239204 [Tanacetum coccineum]
MSLGKVVWNSTFKNGNIRLKTYEELSDKEKLQADCDLMATNIVLQGLPLDVYALVNHHKISKDIWDRVKLLMQGTSLSKQERECKLYDEFDKFSFVKVRDLHTSNYDQIYDYLEQHESTTPQYQQQLLPPIQHVYSPPPQLNPYRAPHRLQKYLPLHIPQQPQAEFPQLDSDLAVPTSLPNDNPIAYINKAMEFLSDVFTPHYPSTNNQFKSSSNQRNQVMTSNNVYFIASFILYHNLWDIIIDGDLQEEVAPAGEQSSPRTPKTAKQLTAKGNQ